MHRIAAWLFVSDHGEYISPKVSGHGHTYHPTKEEYHVPLMVWYSDEYKETFPNKVANVIKHKDYPACADHVFWSVLDMAGIRIDSTLQQVGVSIFGDTLLPHQRTLLLPDGESVMMLD
jgi:glucan phosphoethanolaminetransferase (alkaline phosphatase superfamily)